MAFAHATIDCGSRRAGVGRTLGVGFRAGDERRVALGRALCSGRFKTWQYAGRQTGGIACANRLPVVSAYRRRMAEPVVGNRSARRCRWRHLDRRRDCRGVRLLCALSKCCRDHNDVKNAIAVRSEIISQQEYDGFSNPILSLQAIRHWRITGHSAILLLQMSC